MKMMKDPDAVAEAQKRRFEPNPLSGEEIEGLINLKYARKTAFFDLLPRRIKGLSFANSEISRQPQAIDLA